MLERTKRSVDEWGTETFGGMVSTGGTSSTGLQVVVAVGHPDPTVLVPMIEVRRNGKVYLAVSADDLRYLARCFAAAADRAEGKEVPS